MQSFDADAARVDEQTAAALPAFAVRDAADVSFMLLCCVLLQQSCYRKTSDRSTVANVTCCCLSPALRSSTTTRFSTQPCSASSLLATFSTTPALWARPPGACAMLHAAADTAHWRLQGMMFIRRFEIACLADLAKLQGNVPDSSMLRSGAHSHTHPQRHFAFHTPLLTFGHCPGSSSSRVSSCASGATRRLARWMLRSACRCRLQRSPACISHPTTRAHTHARSRAQPSSRRRLWLRALANCARSGGTCVTSQRILRIPIPSSKSLKSSWREMLRGMRLLPRKRRRARSRQRGW